MESENLVLVFDTETSGLWPKNVDITHKNVNYPYIVQLSFIVFDFKKNVIVKSYNTYIKDLQNVDFNADAFRVTGITKEMCDSGVSIIEAINEFHKYYLQVKHVVAHNLDFDKKMIQLEVIRNYEAMKMNSINDPWILFNDTFNDLWGIKQYCTMEKGKHICNIIIKGKYGDFKKAPKLVELYQKLFKATPENLHDSLIDCMVCLKCYMKIHHSRVIDIPGMTITPIVPLSHPLTHAVAVNVP